MIKRILFLVIFNCIAHQISAQEFNKYTYSVGLRAFSLEQMPKILNQTNSSNYERNYANSMILKVMDNQINYRISGSYLSQDLTFSNQCSTCQEGKGTILDYSFKVGFERNLSYTKVQPYYGVDLGYRSNNFSGTVSILPSQNVLYNVESNKMGLTVTPLIGVKVNLSQNIILYGEGNLEFFYNYERRETVDNIPGSSTNFSSFSRMEYLLKPFSAGIQINFGNRIY